jgi:hypothetical protein
MEFDTLSDDVLIYLVVLVLEFKGIGLSGVLRLVSRRFNHIVNLALPQVSILHIKQTGYYRTLFWGKDRIPYDRYCSADAKFCKNATSMVLDSLSIYSQHFIRFGVTSENLGNVKSISAYGCFFHYSKPGDKIIGLFPRLKSLTLSGIHQFSHDLIDDIRNCGDLTHLDMTCCSSHYVGGVDVDDGMIARLVDKVKKIKYLCLAGNDKVTEWGLSMIGRHLESLTHLDLSGVKISSDETFFHLIGNGEISKNLTYLCLDYTKVTKKGVKALQRRFSKLEISVKGSCADLSYDDSSYDDI